MNESLTNVFNSEYVTDSIDLVACINAPVHIVGCIFRTNSYDSFKILTGNREINRGNVEKLKKSIKEKGYHQSQPIIVDIDFQIIDGQHRFTACKELNEPLYFTIQISDKDSLELTQDLNKNQKNWTVIDYIKSYADRNYEDYKKFLDFIKEQGIGYELAIIILYGSRGSNVSSKIKEGKLIFGENEILSVKESVSKLKDIVNSIPGNLEIDKKIKRSMLSGKVVMAFNKITKCDGYNHKRMIDQVALNYRSIDLRNVSTCGESLINIYNSKLTQKNRLPKYEEIETTKGV